MRHRRWTRQLKPLRWRMAQAPPQPALFPGQPRERGPFGLKHSLVTLVQEGPVHSVIPTQTTIHSPRRDTQPGGGFRHPHSHPLK
eukprot:1151822-Amphidinium_carterae.1